MIKKKRYFKMTQKETGIAVFAMTTDTEHAYIIDTPECYKCEEYFPVNGYNIEVEEILK